MARISIAIASDHAGFSLKNWIKKELAQEVNWLDLGPGSDARCDYPDYAKKLALRIQLKKPALGLLICGSGLGMAMAANRFAGIRAATAESIYSARLAKAHNNANVLCLGARILAPEHAAALVRSWLEADFEGQRHKARIQKIERES